MSNETKAKAWLACPSCQGVRGFRRADVWSDAKPTTRAKCRQCGAWHSVAEWFNPTPATPTMSNETKKCQPEVMAALSSLLDPAPVETSHYLDIPSCAVCGHPGGEHAYTGCQACRCKSYERPAPAAPQADTKKAASVVAAAERLGLLPQAEASAADLARAEEAATDVLLAFDGEQDFWSREEAVIGIIAGIIAAERMAERERCEAEHKQADRRTEALIIAATDLYATAIPFGELPDDVEHALDRLCAIVENQADVIDDTIAAAIRGGKP